MLYKGGLHLTRSTQVSSPPSFILGLHVHRSGYIHLLSKGPLQLFVVERSFLQSHINVSNNMGADTLVLYCKTHPSLYCVLVSCLCSLDICTSLSSVYKWITTTTCVLGLKKSPKDGHTCYYQLLTPHRTSFNRIMSFFIQGGKMRIQI